jgi:hypothetical protein
MTSILRRMGGKVEAELSDSLDAPRPRRSTGNSDVAPITFHDKG